MLSTRYPRLQALKLVFGVLASVEQRNGGNKNISFVQHRKHYNDGTCTFPVLCHELF